MSILEDMVRAQIEARRSFNDLPIAFLLTPANYDLFCHQTAMQMYNLTDQGVHVYGIKVLMIQRLEQPMMLFADGRTQPMMPKN